ncbi:hypothetical protein EIP91_009894 [Steccherinum ochraceum]|uniref:Uncharacterized protein n=1 Tax=Steccherinum ochraceum TaxID=92696 RepID=A0A4R0RXA9_9APHY|nr:hypothetical protein EIP91_009894 [Steccherinum ochraceum]
MHHLSALGPSTTRDRQSAASLLPPPTTTPGFTAARELLDALSLLTGVTALPCVQSGHAELWIEGYMVLIVIMCWVVASVFALATEEIWLSLLHSAANTVLQGIFCIGLIWRMDPFMMPQSFCTTQAILLHTSWACMAGVGAAITILTASRVLHRSSILPRLVPYATLLRLLFGVGFPCMVLIAQTVAIHELNAARPVDGIACDASFPSWVRVLGYAGATLILAIPSFILSLITAAQVTRSRSTLKFQYQETHHQFPPSDDGLTHLPTRRSKRRSYRDSGSPLRTPEPPPLPPPSTDEPLDSSTRTVYAIPNGPDSSSTVVDPPRRARVVAGRTRYHLPYDWIETRYSPDDLQDAYENKDLRHSPTTERSQTTEPSTIQFASPSEFGDARGSMSRVTTPALSAVDIEKDSIRLHVYTGFSSDGQLFLDQDDAISGSLRWTRRSNDSSGRKSELVFAKYDEEDTEVGLNTVAYEERGLPLFKREYNSRDHLQKDALNLRGPASRQTEPHSQSSAQIWLTLAFQMSSSGTQILAAISSLIDIGSRATTPSPFGTQHVALLLAAWSPFLIFAVGKVVWGRSGKV